MAAVHLSVGRTLLTHLDCTIRFAAALAWGWQGVRHGSTTAPLFDRHTLRRSAGCSQLDHRPPEPASASRAGPESSSRPNQSEPIAVASEPAHAPPELTGPQPVEAFIAPRPGREPNGSSRVS